MQHAAVEISTIKFFLLTLAHCWPLFDDIVKKVAVLCLAKQVQSLSGM